MVSKRFFCSCLMVFGCLFILAGSSYGQNSAAVNRLPNGDVLGPQREPGAVGAGPDLLGNFTGGSVLGSGTPLTGLLGGGAVPSGLTGTISITLSLFPNALQNAFMSHLTQLLLNRGSSSDIASLLAQYIIFNDIYERISEIDCGGGDLRSGTAYQVYAENRLIQQIGQMDPGDLLSTAINAPAMYAQIETDVCSAPLPSVGVEASDTAVSSGGAIAPESVTTNGQWTQATSNHIMGRVWSPNSASGTTTCAKGVRLLLGDHPDGLGMPVNTTCHGGARNGQNYHEILRDCNPQWTQVAYDRPEDAPPGCINVYASNCRLGKTPCSRPPATGGQAYGHVEVVATTPEGQKKYVSFKTLGPGGTVKQNYTSTFCCTGATGCTPSVR